MESITDTDDMEQEADAEVDKILFELTAGKLGEAPSAVKDTLPSPAAATADPVADDDESEDDMEEMQQRLQALRSQEIQTIKLTMN